MLLGLRVGDPHDELLGAWLAKENVRDLYLANDRADAEVLIDKTIAGCAEDDVPEVRSLGKTLGAWRTEILAHHDTGASNGPTEGLNLYVKKVKRCGHGFRSFENYRLRVLLHTGGVTWPNRPQPPRIRARAPCQTRRTTLSCTVRQLSPQGGRRSPHRGPRCGREPSYPGRPRPG